MMWQRLLALVHKEFLALFKDPKSRTVLILPPLVQLLVFGYAASFDLKDVPYAVYNEDGGQASRDLLAHFAGASSFRAVRTVVDQQAIAPLLDRREVLLVLHLGPRYGADLRAGRAAALQVIIDGRNSNTALLALNYVRTIVTGYNQARLTALGVDAPPARLESRAWFNPTLDSRWYFVPGIIGMLTLMVSMLVTALSVAREREQGTFDQLLVTPLRPSDILIGKALPGLVIGVVQASVILLVATAWFRVPFLGSLTAFYLALLLFLLSGIGSGLLISALSATQQQGLLGAFLFMVPAVILSGFATPIANMPPAVQLVTYVDPLRYFLVVLRKLFLEGAGLAQVQGELWPMALIGTTTLALAAWLFRYRLY